jgi:hypothetical protein
MMSGVVEESDDTTMFCASCGIAAVDDIKLKKCTACYLVRYCSVKCQKDHRPKHKKECKKRAAELRDEVLFKQPESSHLGDCPICCLPLSLDGKKYVVMECCYKLICNGCHYANVMRELEGKLQHKCPFCRHPSLATEEVRFLMNVKRAEANDPAAIFQMGVKCLKEGDYDGAFQYWTKAAGLGDVTAHFNLSLMYHNGEVGKDEKKEVHHLEQAAIGGHPTARHNLGCIEGVNGRTDRAIKHWIMASKLGEDAALSSLRSFYSKGFVGKEDFASALRGHQAAVDATKSHQREAAA